MDSLYEKILITKYLNFEFMGHFLNEETLSISDFNQETLGQLSKRSMKFMMELSGIQGNIFTLMDQDFVN